MKRDYASKSKHGVEKVWEIGQVPLALIQAQTCLGNAMKYVDGDDRKDIVDAHDHIHAILNFIAGGNFDLTGIVLTDAQRTLIHYALDDAEWAKEQCGRIGAEAAK